MANSFTQYYELALPSPGDAGWDDTLNSTLTSVDSLIYSANQNIVNGVQGPEGPSGPEGLQGPQGLQGSKGDTGAIVANATNGPLVVNGSLLAKINQGVITASGAETSPTSNDGLANALTLVGSAGGQVLLDPTYTGNEFPQEWGRVGESIDNRSYKYPFATTITDTRSGGTKVFSNNVQCPQENGTVITSFRYDQHANVLTENATIGLQLTGFVGANGAYDYGSEYSGTAVNFGHIFASKGVFSLINGTVTKSGTGDFPVDYRYTQYYGGQINGDDEGAVGYSIHMDEGGSGQGGNKVPSLTINSVGAGATPNEVFLRTSLVNGTNKLLGTGRYALLMKDGSGNDTSVLKVNVIASGKVDDSYSTMTVDPSTPISNNLLTAAYGKMDTFYVPYNNDVPQQILNIPVRGISGTAAGGFVPGIAVLVGKHRTEHCVILGGANAPTTISGGVQNISIMARQNADGSNGNNSNQYYIFQDPQVNGKSAGLGQTLARIACYDQGQGKPVMALPVAGAINSTTLVLGTPYVQGQAAFLPFQPVVVTVQLNPVDSNGNVYFTVNNPQGVNLGQYASYTNWKISGSGAAGYDGPVSLTYVDSNPGYYFHVTNPATPTATPSVTLTLNAGVNQIDLRHGAEVIGVCDPTQQYDSLGSYLLLEPNDITWPVGGTVDVPGHYSTGMSFESKYLSSAMPSFTGQAIQAVQISGPIAQNIICNNFWINNPDTNYISSGGYWNRPSFTNLQGPWGELFNLGSVTNPNLLLFSLPGYNPSYISSHFTTLWQFGTKTSGGQRVIDHKNDSVTDYFGNLTFTMHSGSFNFNGAPVQVGNQVVDQVATATGSQMATPLAQVQSLISAGSPSAYTGSLAVTTTTGTKTLTITGGLITAIN